MADRTIRVTVVGDARSLQNALKGSESSLKSLDATAAKSQQSLKNMESGLGSFGKGAALLAGASAISAAFIKVTDAASRLQSASAANQRVFGAETTRMQEAAKAAQDYGLSQSAYLQTSAKLGAQLQNLGMEQDQAATSAQSLMRMGENLAAVFGTDVPMAVTAISAALRGEFDPLEQYGVKLTAAKVAAKQSAEGITQAQAVMALAMEQSEFSVGAAAEAMDTYAGKQRAFAASWENAQAAIGKGFLPVASAVVDTLAKIANLVQSIPQGIMEFAGTLTAAVIGVKALQYGLGAMASRTAAWSNAMIATGGVTATAGAGMGRFSAALSKTGQAIPIVGALLVGLSEAWSAADDRIKEAATSQEAFTSALMDTGLTTAQLDSVAASVQRVGQGVSAWGKAASFLAGGVLGGALLDKWLNIDTAAAQLEIDNLNSSLRELMAVNPTQGAIAVQQTFQALVAGGMPAATAIQHLSGSMIEANRAIALWMNSTTVAASNLQGLVAAFDAATAAAQKTEHALDAVFAGLDVDVAVADWKAALAGITKAGQVQDPHVLQSLNQQWRAVTEAMRENGAGIGQVTAKWAAMRGQMRAALAAVGVEGQQATSILNKIFGKKWQVVAAFKGDTTDIKNKATVAERMLNAIKQNNPAKIFAKWFGKGETSRADRDIDGVKQDNPATITADGNQAVSEALRVQSQLYGLPDAVTIMINVGASISAAAQQALGLFGSGEFLSRTEFGEEEVPWMGVQMRSANSALAALAKNRGRRVEQVIVVRLKMEGEWNVAIKGLERLEELATRTNKAGKPTAQARAAQRELRTRRQLAAAATEYIRNVTTSYQGEERGYAFLKRRLDALKEARANLAREMTEAINAVNIGSAWSGMQSNASELQSTIEGLRGEMDDLKKARAQTWNPREIEYYNQKIMEAAVKLKAAQQAQSKNTLGTQLQEQLNKTRRFYNAINKLRQQGMSNEALQELIRQGADQGADIADALVGDAALRNKYSDVFAEAAQMSRSLGETVADDAYKAKIKEVQDAITALRKEVEGWLKRHKKIKFTINWVDVTPNNATRATRRAPSVPRDNGNARAYSQPQTINVTVKGNLVDPEGAARAIKKVLRDSANRNGKVAWAGAGAA